MRTLYEIIESAKDGEKPSHDECYWAMLALSALHHFDNQDISKLAEYYGKLGFEKNAPFGAKFRASESFNRFKKALNKSPQEWVGWNNDPSNPEYQKMRQVANRLLSKVIGGAG